MIAVILTLAIFIAIIWYLGLRVTAIYGAYLGGAFAHSLGLHWITIGIGAFLGACAVYAIIYALSAMAEKRPWAGYAVMGLICVPAFLVGFGAVTDYMQSPGQDAGVIESTIVGGLAGIVMAVFSFGAYKRDLGMNTEG